MPRILRAHSEGRLMRMGDESNRVDITPVSNVVDAIILALDAEEKAINQIYNISNGKLIMASSRQIIIAIVTSSTD